GSVGVCTTAAGICQKRDTSKTSSAQSNNPANAVAPRNQSGETEKNSRSDAHAESFGSCSTYGVVAAMVCATDETVGTLAEPRASFRHVTIDSCTWLKRANSVRQASPAPR